MKPITILPFLLLVSACQSNLTGNEGNFVFSYTADDAVGDFNKPIGVGASLEIQVTTVGSRLPVNLSAVTSSDTEVLEVTGTATNSFVVHGLNPGTSLIEIEADTLDGVTTDSVNLLAAAPDVVKLYHSCEPDERTALYQTETSVLIPFDLEKANGQPVIGYGLHPVEITPAAGGVLDETSLDQANLHVVLGSTAGEVTVSSTIDDGTLNLNVVSPGAIDGAAFNPLSTDGTEVVVFEGETRFVHVFPTVADVRICQSNVTMSAESKTPELCKATVATNLEETTFVNESLWVKIEAVAFGTCIFGVTFPEGADGVGTQVDLEVSVAKKP
jgi:hypothetical protein